MIQPAANLRDESRIAPYTIQVWQCARVFRVEVREATDGLPRLVRGPFWYEALEPALTLALDFAESLPHRVKTVQGKPE